MGIYIIGDVIRNTRIAMNLSQEELAEGICMPNYLSRIECGKQVPQKKIYDMLMDKMESHMNRMTVSLDVDEFELIDELSRISGTEIPNAIEEIRNADIRHTRECEAGDMKAAVKEILGV